jgi:predicted hydrocarbon binding protein
MGKEKQGPVHYEVDEDEGIVTGKLLESRILALGSYGWATIQAELDSTFITGGSVILQRMGYSYGKYLGALIKRKAGKKDPANGAVGEMIKMVKEAGWGNMLHSGGDLAQGVLNVVVRDCIFCLHMKGGTNARCFFLAGVIAGVADEVTGNIHRSHEGRCRAKGDNVCEIVMERVSEGTAPVE